MNAAVEYHFKSCTEVRRNREQLIKAKEDFPSCHIFVVTNKMQHKHYSTMLFQRRFNSGCSWKKNINLSLEKL